MDREEVTELLKAGEVLMSAGGTRSHIYSSKNDLVWTVCQSGCCNCGMPLEEFLDSPFMSDIEDARGPPAEKYVPIPLAGRQWCGMFLYERVK